ncbi:MAG: glucose-6-phosphate isomerase [Alphaproteobacteria bacterium]|nr:glucose-6-phosphate isomerase [Alphaproteobacteria bacterium]MBV9370289.1 glucose-6-phosphate isomerase [Alphaproteobacteria bacterium]MBV9899774.1 glucose-6-phosphate isomerase [Alphaproteobacteria bacterium]
MNADQAWAAVEQAESRTLKSLFDAEPDRVERLAVEEAGLRFDFSKTHLDRDLVAAFQRLAEEQDLAGARDALFAGAIVNPTEGRAAEHSAERGQGAPESVALASALHARMRALIDAIEAEAFGPIRHVLHIGIGGSALGPAFLIDSLGREAGRYDAAVVSNVDGAALEEALAGFDPEVTLIAIASKTFTTSETMLNARSALAWLEQGGVADPYGRVVALTASPERAVAFGVDETRVLPFPETVGGRYSLWSSIGFPAALALGWEAFEQLLEGAAAMDRHFRLAPFEANAPLLAACVDRYYANTRRAETRAVFAYDERLRLLPPYLQQLEMESNGKSVKLDGSPVGRATAPVTWGGVGTDAQHAVFQLLHQGTHLVPVEFVACIEPGHALDEAHHRQLLTNCFAQGAALMAGKASDDPHRSYPGDRPSTTILLDRLDPATLGALIAFYEHRTFANAVFLGINPFDQFGVELGKEMAKAMDGADPPRFDPSTQALIARALGEAR